jgi:hypothetical protein
MTSQVAVRSITRANCAQPQPRMIGQPAFVAPVYSPQSAQRTLRGSGEKQFCSSEKLLPPHPLCVLCALCGEYTRAPQMNLCSRLKVGCVVSSEVHQRAAGVSSGEEEKRGADL